MRRECRRSADETLARLLNRAAQGDEAAFGRFYDATSSQVFGMALAVVGDRAHAVDIAEAVYVSVWKAASSLPGQGVELRAWLSALARRELMSRIIRAAPEQP